MSALERNAHALDRLISRGISEPTEDGAQDDLPPRFKLLTADELMQLPPLRWRVRGVLPQEGLAAIFGPSRSGKSFLVLDLAMKISAGEDWFAHRTKAAPVAYCALEGEAGISGRVAAYRHKHGPKVSVRFLLDSLNLLNPSDVVELGKAIRAAGCAGGVTILDTLNRAAPGADENDSAEMGQIIAAAKRLQAAVGGLVLLIHHTGKDASKGPRGHSSLNAALDAAIEVRRDGDRREIVLSKVKDGADGTAHAFRLAVVEIDEDEDGEAVTSCTVEPDETAAETVRRAKIPKGGNQRITYDIAGELLKQGKHLGQGGAPPTRPCIRLDELIESCRGRLPVPPDRIPERVRLAVTGLINSGCVAMKEGWIWLP